MFVVRNPEVMLDEDVDSSGPYLAEPGRGCVYAFAKAHHFATREEALRELYVGSARELVEVTYGIIWKHVFDGEAQDVGNKYYAPDSCAPTNPRWTLTRAGAKRFATAAEARAEIDRYSSSAVIGKWAYCKRSEDNYHGAVVVRFMKKVKA